MLRQNQKQTNFYSSLYDRIPEDQFENAGGYMLLAVAAFMTGGCRHGGAYQKEKPHGN